MDNKVTTKSPSLQGDGRFVQLAPHIRSNESVTKIMRDVIIALAPAVVASVYFFGMNALIIYLISVVCCVGSEFIYQKLAGKESQIGDLSSIVTGLLLAMNMPAGVPWYVPAISSVFAIIIVKEAFGGIGGNFVNPALAGRAMAMLSWPQIMATYTVPGVDAASAATPLTIIKAGKDLASLPSLQDMFIGNIGGVIGETSALLLLIGACYLLIRKVIDWKIPVIYILTTIVFLFVFGIKADIIPYEVLGGGLMLGALFMATDYSSTPQGTKGKIIFAIGCGLITALIRTKGNMAEGVSYSILLMNVASPLIERLTKTEAYGEAK
ncbi:RnfABCDGE type electron transport complex subunit D [Aedoeadaptatus coxii]|uniref:Ion-translocating oxidoreductase complex subunit D n=1 Tax=Aedoeadaptatus coxii TaxID=755172 RepID=A0A134AC50_9FIRM|nr:RnfABCDGE type electron transport complex subunit D [Peptoniphilus coxii]KXB65255.1 electron transport complex, RnfABCDGE type, D subunit [Peptoniphilus coxii]